MGEVLEYHTPGRSLVSVIALLAGLVIIGLSPYIGDSVAIWACFVILGAMLAHQLLANPATGSRIDGSTWTTHIDSHEIVVSLDEIKIVEVPGWGAIWPRCTLHLHDGTEMQMPAKCLPPLEQLAEKLAAHGVPIGKAKPKRLKIRTPDAVPPAAGQGTGTSLQPRQ